ncbi:DNA methyltransferase (plasmid) [Rossellomorea sp. AcN35-11]|nr:DNA methyltransferase [Rossellomorea sp. AcN35-11]
MLKEGGYCVENLPAENHKNTKYLRKIREYAESVGFQFYALIPWIKFGDNPRNTGRFKKDREYLLVLSKSSARRLSPIGKPYMTKEMLPAQFDMTKQMKELTKSHQAEKPVLLWEQVIHLLTEPGEVILDQYSGSGSATEAAINTNRLPILIELLSDNIKKIRNRLGLPALLKDRKRENLEKTFRAKPNGQLALF